MATLDPRRFESHEIAGQTLGELARIERGAMLIANRLWRGEYGLARPLIWSRLRFLCREIRNADAQARTSSYKRVAARGHTERETNAGSSPKKHWRDIAASRRLEASDWLALLVAARWAEVVQDTTSGMAAVQDAAEARQRTCDRLKAAMSDARRAYLFAHRAADGPSRNHWRRIEHLRRAEARDILGLLLRCRKRHHELATMAREARAAA